MAALGLSKGTWHYAQRKRSYEEKHSSLRQPLFEIARHHPEYGYRRTKAELWDRGIPVNRKVVERLHLAWDLAVIRRIRKPKKNSVAKLLQETGAKVNLVAGLTEIDDFEVLYTDYTEGLIVHHDQDGVYLGHGWLYELAVRDHVRVSYSKNGAKGNVYMESFNSRFKEENRLLFWEQKDFASLKKVVDQRIRYYNHVLRHSALGNQSPVRYLTNKGKIPG